MAVNVDSRRLPVAREVAAVRHLVERKEGLTRMELRTLITGLLALVLVVGVIALLMVGRTVPSELWGMALMAVVYYVGSQASQPTPPKQP